MNQNLAVTNGSNNHIAKVDFDNDMINLIKKSILPPGADATHLQLFIHQAKRTGLDPLTRQIYCTLKDGKLSVQATIDGFRLIAERSGEYEGQTNAQWCDKDGIWYDVWLKEEFPAAAKVGVYRKGFKEPIYAIARWDSYVQMSGGKPRFNWAKMSDLMIAKCAEALALRKAFPQELSGIYTTEEMASVPEDENRELKQSTIDQLIKDAEADFEKAQNRDEVRNIWNKYDKLKKNNQFLELVKKYTQKFPEEKKGKDSEEIEKAEFLDIKDLKSGIQLLKGSKNKTQLDENYSVIQTCKFYNDLNDEQQEELYKAYSDMLFDFDNPKSEGK